VITEINDLHTRREYQQVQRPLADRNNRVEEGKTINKGHEEHPLGCSQSVGEQASIKEEVTGTSC